MTCVSILDVARAEAAAAAAGVGPECDQTLPVLIDSSDLGRAETPAKDVQAAAAASCPAGKYRARFDEFFPRVWLNFDEAGW